MTPEQWTKLKSAFNLALESDTLPPDLLADDPPLRNELVALLAEHANDPSSPRALLNPSHNAHHATTPDGAPHGTPIPAQTPCDSLLDPSLHSNPITPPPTDLASLPPGTRIGPYIILSLLGRGGMGEVYSARQLNPERTVALKILPSDNHSRHAAQRLEAEAAMLARLHHPGIASIIEAGILPACSAAGAFLGPRPYFSMELVNGLPITTFAREHTLDPAQRIDLMRCVCEAVAHAHQRGIIHRDLKPANILVTADGQPKILDFGIARLINREAGSALTHPGWVPGTLAYMSPEQASGDPDSIDTRSDVYALGVILFELLARQLPISPAGKSHLEMLRAIREDAPPRMSIPRGTLRGDAQVILTAALHKDPAQRYQSAAALAADLSHYLHCEPLAIRRPSAAYILRTFARRRWREVTVAGIALTLGLSIAAWQFTLAIKAQRLAEQRLDDLRIASSKLVTDLYDQLGRFASTAEVREYLASEAARRLDAIVAASGNQPAALWDLSTAIYKFGQVTGHPGQANTGHRAQSLALITRAAALREQVLATDPHNREYRTGTAATCITLALITEDAVEALRLVERALALEQSLAEEFPTDFPLRDQFAYHYAVQGTILAHAGLPFDTSFEHARAISEALIADDPANNTWLGTLGTIVSIHAARWRSADLPRAIALYKQAREILVKASHREPEEYTYIRHISNADRCIAAGLALEGHLDQAIALTDASLATYRAWLPRDPDNSMFRQDLVDSLCMDADLRITAAGPAAAQVPTLLAQARELLLKSRAPEHLAPEETDRLNCIIALEAKITAPTSATTAVDGLRPPPPR